MPLTQRDRILSFITPLGEDKLLVRGMSGGERISAPFEYVIDLISEDIDIKPVDLLGKQATLSLRLHDGGKRDFNGWINRFSHIGFDGAEAIYQASLVPWLWFLSRTADCRIFQDQQVPDIVKSIFREHGFTDFDDRLSGTYRQWVYCVQYRETDFNFINRLLEHEGIYYFFEHQDGKHRLILADGLNAHAPLAGSEEIPYFPPDAMGQRERDHIDAWIMEQQVLSGAFVNTSFDFTAPRKNLQGTRNNPKQHDLADYEVFDYPCDYVDPADGDSYARVRLEEVQADQELARAEGTARALTAGALFTLTGHPRNDQNRQYLILSADYRFVSDEFGSNQDRLADPVVRISLRVMDAQIPFRPARKTPKPFVQGPQTAIVVGKSGEEIWTDQYGRVKVQFHWDRYGKQDENSSCWVRVSHPWAGKNWGAIALPRIGQEVVVSFLEGDPDQPLITGRVYNGDCMPPYGLPANQTQSGIKSRSSKGGSGANCNEIRMEDKSGEEELLFHAERNQTIEVENDESHWVGHDRTKKVDHNETTTVGNNRTESVGADETIDIGANEDIRIQGNRTEKVGANEDITIGANRTESVGANESVQIGASRTLKVGASESVTIGASRSEQIGATLSQQVGGSVSLTSGGPFTINAAGGMTIIAPGGTKILDFELDQIGGTFKQGYAYGLNFNGIVIETNGVKAEATGSTNAVVGLKFEKIGADLGAKDVLQKGYALACLSEATGIEMVTLKILM